MSAAVISAILAEIEAAVGVPPALVSAITALLNAVPPAVWARIDAWLQAEGMTIGRLALENAPRLLGLLWQALAAHGREVGAPLVLPEIANWGIPQPGPTHDPSMPSGDWP